MQSRLSFHLPHLLCLWHINRAILSKIKKVWCHFTQRDLGFATQEDIDEPSQIEDQIKCLMKNWWKCVNATTEECANHLFPTHQIGKKRTRAEDDKEEQDLLRQWEDRQTKVAAFVAGRNVERFRGLLVEWVVRAQIPFSDMEDKGFRDILQALLRRWLERLEGISFF